MITTGSIAVCCSFFARRNIVNSGKAVSQAGSSMAYAVTKAAQLQLVKCLGATQGPKIRVNTVLPGLLLTEWVGDAPLLRCVRIADIDCAVGKEVLHRDNRIYKGEGGTQA